MQWNRDLRVPLAEIRAREGSAPAFASGEGTVCLPEMRRGRVALCIATLLARSTGRPVPHLDYPSAAQATGVAQGQLAYYRALERARLVRIVADVGQLEHHLAEWQAWDAAAAPDPDRAPPLGFVIGMESADPTLDPADLPVWHAAGVHVIGPAHYGPGRYAGGTGSESDLADLGVRLLAEMERLGVILDLTHFSDAAFWQALEQYGGPVLASHNNCRALVPGQRQFSDEQLRAIFARDGVIGVACDAWMLQPGWVMGESRNDGVTLDCVVDHVDHVCQLAGNSRHAALGSDLDGGFGRAQSPCDLDTIADLQKIPALLARRGYGEADIGAIMHGNWVRLLRQSWKM